MNFKELFSPSKRKIAGMILLALIAFMSLPILLSMVFVTGCSSVFCKICYAILYIVGIALGFPGTLLWLFRFSSASWSFIIQLVFDYILACLFVHYYIDKRHIPIASQDLTSSAIIAGEFPHTLTHKQAATKKKPVKKKSVKKKLLRRKNN